MINPDDIFHISDEKSFNTLALEIFRFQANYNPVYKKYIEIRRIDLRKIKTIWQIPFLPIELFKTQKIITGYKEPEIVFLSSRTTGTNPSCHYISYPSIYETSIMKGFEYAYGDPEKFCFLALLPSYLEHSDSSLVYMVDKLIRNSKYRESGFYLNNIDALLNNLDKLRYSKIPVILFGASFALMDLAEKYPVDLNQVIIMETGGMKGRRKEITRDELHLKLMNSFKVKEIHSEYGMTELLSQAYSRQDGLFIPPPWMKVLIRNTYDPSELLNPDKTGCINIIDLANIYSVSFIAADDLGKVNAEGAFEVLGRYDAGEVRGCNLLVA